MQGLMLQTPCVGAHGGNCGSKTIMTTKEEESNGTSNNQPVAGVQVGGKVIKIAWHQIRLCQRAQRGEKEQPPLWQHDVNNNNNKRCKYDSIAIQAQEQPSSFGDRYCLSFKSRKALVAQVSAGRIYSKKHFCFFPTSCLTRETKTVLPTSYV
jgi:hypothetical protein